MHVVLAGEGPAVEAVAAALGDVDCETERGDPGDVATGDLGVVVDDVGADAFETANDTAVGAGTPWIAVERGGLGATPLPDVDVGISGFGPETGCFECLEARVASNRAEAAAPGTDDEPVAGPEASTVRLAGAYAGREAAVLASGGESTLFGGVHEVPGPEREFHPVPGCGCDDADARDRRVRTDHRDVDLDAALAAAERALDERVGLVAQVGEAESFPAPYYLAQTCDTRAFSAARAAPQSAGVDEDWNAAFMKALGEGLERYAAGVYAEDDFETAPPGVVDGVSPADVVRADVAPAVDPEEPLRWVPGVDLSTGDATYLAAELVQFPPPSERHVDAITTGLGLGSSGADAIAAGLTEVLERDATMLAWYSTFEPLELDVRTEGFRSLAKRARSEDLSVTALLVTQDVDVPVVAVAVHREDGEWPRFAVGSDAALDARVAATDALAEALQNWMELRSMGRAEASEEDGAIGAFADYPRAAEAFLDAAGPVPAGSVGPDEVPTGTDRMQALVERTTDAGLTPFVARITPRDVAGIGFEAVRVVVPEAQPLFTDDPVFGERARSVPDSLGFEPRLDHQHHPYP